MDWNALVGLGGVPVVVAIVGVIRLWGLPASYAPIAAVIAGVLWNVAMAPLVPGGVYPLALQGVLAGLAAAGLYDSGQAVGRLLKEAGGDVHRRGAEYAEDAEKRRL